MLIRPLLVVFCCAVCLLAACKKEEAVRKPLDPVMKSHYYFMPGSYWVFVDSLTGSIDSFAVVNANDAFIEGSHVSYEQAYSNIQRFNVSVGDTTVSTLTLFLREVNNLQLILQEYHGGFTKIYNYAPVAFPFRDSTYTYFEQPKDTISTVAINNVSINGQTYNCERINLKNTYQVSTVAFSFSDDFFISPDAGFVRITLRHFIDPVAHDWQLLRYHIVR
jgi:hypothetical protein